MVGMSVNPLKTLIFAIFVLGGSGIAAQTVLLRELLVLFSGNELSLGVIIGNWVICEAFGAYAGGHWCRRIQTSAGTFILLSILFSLVFPASVYLARIFKLLAGIPPDQGVGLGPLFAGSLLTLITVGFLHGFLFISACSLYRGLTAEDTSTVGKVYTHETIGTIVGGISISYLLIPSFHSFQIAVVVALFNGLACVALASVLPVNVKRLTTVVLLLFIVLTAFLLAGGGADRLHESSIKRQWQGKDIVAYRNSFYQNIAVTRDEGQYTFFADGIPLLTTPVPDIASVEEFVHLPLLAHPAPRDILVISGGAGGIISEILKYPSIARIDYVEIDPLLLQTIQGFPTPLTEKELGSPRVHLRYGDARTYLMKTPDRYDVVFLNHPPPQSLQSNRFFTKEFFVTVKNALHKTGIFVLPLTGSLTYYSRELKELNAGIRATLDRVFPTTAVIPGDTNLFLASPARDGFSLSPVPMARTLQERNIQTRLITPEHLGYRLDPDQGTWLAASLQGTEARINRDFSPSGLFYTMAYRNLLFSPWLSSFFDWARDVSLSSITAAAVGLLALLYLLTGRYRSLSIPMAIASTGFSAMLFELLLFSGFQVFFGYVFYQVGILITAFMGGIAAGSRAVTIRLGRISDGLKAFVGMEGCIVVFALVLTLLFGRLDPTALTGSVSCYVGFLGLLFIAGMLTGMEFPLAARLHAQWITSSDPGTSGPLERSAGIIYSADLFGAWLGGVLGGLVLMPVLGLANSCLVLAVFKAGSMLIVARSGKDRLEWKK